MKKLVRELKAEVDLLTKNPLAYSDEGRKLAEQVNELQEIIAEVLHTFSDTKRIEKLANDQATLRNIEELKQNFEKLAEQNEKILSAMQYLQSSADQY